MGTDSLRKKVKQKVSECVLAKRSNTKGQIHVVRCNLKLTKAYDCLRGGS